MYIYNYIYIYIYIYKCIYIYIYMRTFKGKIKQFPLSSYRKIQIFKTSKF